MERVRIGHGTAATHDHFAQDFVEMTSQPSVDLDACLGWAKDLVNLNIMGTLVGWMLL